MSYMKCIKFFLSDEVICLNHKTVVQMWKYIVLLKNGEMSSTNLSARLSTNFRSNSVWRCLRNALK